MEDILDGSVVTEIFNRLNKVIYEIIDDYDPTLQELRTAISLINDVSLMNLYNMFSDESDSDGQDLLKKRISL